jgi:alanine racemase
VAPELAQPGAWVEIIGRHRTVDEVAADCGTIGYEILTSLGARYRRHYLGPT